MHFQAAFDNPGVKRVPCRDHRVGVVSGDNELPVRIPACRLVGDFPFEYRFALVNGLYYCRADIYGR